MSFGNASDLHKASNDKKRLLGCSAVFPFLDARRNASPIIFNAFLCEPASQS